MHVVSQAAEVSPGFEADYWEFPEQRLIVVRARGYVSTENLFVAIRKLPDWFRRQPKRVVDWREVEFQVLQSALLDRAVVGSIQAEAADEIAVFVMRPGMQHGVAQMFEGYSRAMARKLVVVKSIADAGLALALDFSWYPGERAAARGGSVR